MSRAVAAGLINAALKPLSEEARDALIERLAFELGVKPPERPPAEYGAINWRQAREMADAGVEIGSHTLTHPILTGLGDARLREEVAQSRDRIQNALGRKVETFCYPNGDYDLRTQREVARAGYRLAVTTDVGLNNGRNDPLALRRIHGEYDLARFVKNTSGSRWRIEMKREQGEQDGQGGFASRAAWLTAANSIAFGLSFIAPLLLVRMLSQTEFGVYKQVFQILMSTISALICRWPPPPTTLCRARRRRSCKW